MCSVRPCPRVPVSINSFFQLLTCVVGTALLLHDSRHQVGLLNPLLVLRSFIHCLDWYFYWKRNLHHANQPEWPRVHSQTISCPCTLSSLTCRDAVQAGTCYPYICVFCCAKIVRARRATQATIHHRPRATTIFCLQPFQSGGRESKPSAPTDNGQPAIFGRGVASCLPASNPCRRSHGIRTCPQMQAQKEKGPAARFSPLCLFSHQRLSLFARLDGELIREGSRGEVERWWSSRPSVGRNSSRR